MRFEKIRSHRDTNRDSVNTEAAENNIKSSHFIPNMIRRSFLKVIPLKTPIVLLRLPLCQVFIRVLIQLRSSSDLVKFEAFPDLRSKWSAQGTRSQLFMRAKWLKWILKKLSISEINEMLFIWNKLFPVVTELELKTIFDIDFSWVWRT